MCEVILNVFIEFYDFFTAGIQTGNTTFYSAPYVILLGSHKSGLIFGFQ